MKKNPELTVVEHAEAFLAGCENPAPVPASIYNAYEIIQKLLKEIDELNCHIDMLYEQDAGASM